MRRHSFALLAYLCAGLACVGLVVPGLPTVPFLLAAAWAGARGSDRLHAWIHNHAQFGPLLRDWHEQGAVPPRAKWLTIVMLLASWLLLVRHLDADWIAPGAGALFVLIAAFVVSRPTPRPGAPTAEHSSHTVQSGDTPP